MNDPVNKLLGAYQDGELDGATRARVEHHLAQCAGCRHLLEQGQALSLLLHNAPAPRPRRTTRQFAAGLRPLLPERPVAAISAHTPWKPGWPALPVILLATGAILWVSGWITSLLILGDQTGLLGHLGQLIPAASQGTSVPFGYTFLQGFLNIDLANSLMTVQAGWELVDTFVLSLAGEALLALMYLAWLVVAWNKRPGLVQEQASA